MNKQLRNTAVAVGTAVASAGAMAALPTEVTGAFSSISETVTGILALVWPIAVSLTVGFVGLKLFKKGAAKAS